MSFNKKSSLIMIGHNLCDVFWHIIQSLCVEYKQDIQGYVQPNKCFKIKKEHNFDWFINFI